MAHEQLDKGIITEHARQAGMYQNPHLLLALIEIREAIEAQTDRLAGEQEHWGESAFVKLAADVSCLDQASGAQLHALHDGQARLGVLEESVHALEGRIAALEQTLQNVLDHQQETAKLVLELAAKLENVPAAGGAEAASVRIFAQSPGNSPTAG